jgi:hypothetical protein
MLYRPDKFSNDDPAPDFLISIALPDDILAIVNFLPKYRPVPFGR